MKCKRILLQHINIKLRVQYKGELGVYGCMCDVYVYVFVHVYVHAYVLGKIEEHLYTTHIFPWQHQPYSVCVLSLCFVSCLPCFGSVDGGELYNLESGITSSSSSLTAASGEVPSGTNPSKSKYTSVMDVQ